MHTLAYLATAHCIISIFVSVEIRGIVNMMDQNISLIVSMRITPLAWSVLCLKEGLVSQMFW